MKRVVFAAERMGRNGEGVGRVLPPMGLALELHVEGLLPGEVAEVEIEHRSHHRREAWGRILRRTNAAEERVVPSCAGYGRCGGCVLQHLAYPAQLSWKRERVADSLVSQGIDRELVGPACIPSAHPLGYRSRVKLIVSRDEVSAKDGGKIRLGAFSPRSHDWVDVSGCRVNLPSLTALGSTVARTAEALRISSYHEKNGMGTLRYLLLRETARGEQQLGLVCAEPLLESQVTLLIAALCTAHPHLRSIVFHHNATRGNALLPFDPAAADEGAEPSADLPDQVLLGDAYLWEEVGSLPLRLSARSFFQVNREVAARIYSDVAAQVASAFAKSEAAGGQAEPFILDLYCGVGGLGLTALSTWPKARLWGIESSPDAVADAQASAERAGLGMRARFQCGRVESLLPAALTETGSPAALFLNPPRRGCEPEVLRALFRHPVAHIFYMSCNPETLARDLKILIEGGYRLSAVTPYDMHPGTPHIEALAELIRPS